MSAREHRRTNRHLLSRRQESQTENGVRYERGNALQRVRVAPQMLTSQEVFQLQRAIGNQAVSRLLAAQRQQPPRMQHLHAGRPAIVQRKRTVKEEEHNDYMEIESLGQKDKARTLKETELHYDDSLKSGIKIKEAIEKWQESPTGKEEKFKNWHSGYQVNDTMKRAKKLKYTTAIEKTDRSDNYSRDQIKLISGRGSGINNENIGSATGDYENYYTKQSGTFIAASNSREADRERDKNKEPLTNSEIIWMQYKQAIEEINKNQKDQLSEKGNFKKLIRDNISNVQTRDTIFWTDNGKEAAEDDPQTVTEKDGDDFWALIGTPNGRSAGWLIAQHGTSMGVKGMKEIKYKLDRLEIAFDF